MDTLFAKIITREIPAHIVYEDELVLAFLDINPINLGHTLVVPKKQFINIFDGDSQTLVHMMVVGQKVAQALVSLKLAEGVNIVMNNGAEASQEVWHAHLHVIPRKAGDHSFSSPTHVALQSGDLDKTKEQLLGALSS